MKLSRYEQETIVNYNAGEQTATLYTRDKAVMRKLDAFVADFPDTYKLIGQDEVFKIYSFPKSYVSCRKPRAVSTKQREWARQMMIERNRAKRIYWTYLCFYGKMCNVLEAKTILDYMKAWDIGLSRKR